jgi:hypothetical protein
MQLAGRRVPPLVTQIADGENGGVMMHEFPPKYLEVVRECLGSRTPMLNVSEYLEQLFAAGVQPGDLQAIQPLFQHRIWQRMAPGDGPARLAEVVEQLRREDSRFHVEGGSWTSDLSWVRGYEQVLIPMEQASSLFHERILARGLPTTPATAGPCSTCWRPRPAATATGDRASGPTTAPSCPAGPSTSSRSRRLDAARSVARAWAEHDLKPWQTGTFKVSTEPQLEAKVRDVVGLYLTHRRTRSCCAWTRSPRSRRWSAPNHPARSLPAGPERRTHDYLRHGTTTLFAALEVATGRVTDACHPRHRHGEFLAFLQLVAKAYPRRQLHVVLDNYATHSTPRSRPGWAPIPASGCTSPRPTLPG